MTRSWLVMINSTHIALAPNTFTAIISTEILLSIIAIICMPFVSEAIYSAGVIHRNFRIQVRLISAVFFISTISRYVLLYYQLYDIPLNDFDYFLVVVNITRDASFGYLCGIIPSFALERTVATIFWKWYERQTPDTMIALLLIEMTNAIPATINATGWILGYWGFFFKDLYMWLTVAIGGILFLSTYAYNRYMFRSLSVKVGQYSVAKTFQIRENCRIMECLLFVGIPLASFTTISFALFCFYKWAPTEWRLSRHISIALFDLFVVISCQIFMILAINMDSEFRRQFNNLKAIAVIRVIFRMKYPTYKKSVLKSAFVAQPGLAATTQSYFNQFEAAWK